MPKPSWLSKQSKSRLRAVGREVGRKMEWMKVETYSLRRGTNEFVVRAVGNEVGKNRRRVMGRMEVSCKRNKVVLGN